MKQSRNKGLGLLALLIFSLVSAMPAGASDYPTKPVTLVIPYPAGGSTDLTGRALANAAKKYLGQPIIVENKSGGGGTVGPSLVIPKPPDGYTLGVYPANAAFIGAHMGKLNFHPLDDMTHIIRYTGYLFGLVVREDAQWKTMQDLIPYARQNPQKVSYGTPGMGTSPHLAMEDLAIQAGGIQWIHMPYKGGAETNTALLGGHVDSVSDSSGWGPFVDSGKFRLLAIYSGQRSPRYPQVPTLKELGYDAVYPSPLEIIGPKGMPKPLVQRIHDAFRKAMDDPEYQAILKKFDMPMIYLGPEELEMADRQEYEKIGRVVQKLGLQKK
jgi:tripartite-type tricarboxylate transporter receptor subunit TctC